MKMCAGRPDPTEFCGHRNGEFVDTYAITMDTGGNIYVVESRQSRVQKFSKAGTFLAKWGSLGDKTGEFNEPMDIATNSRNEVYIVDKYNDRIQKFTSSGVFLSQWGKEGTGAGEFSFAFKDIDHGGGIGIDANDYVYVLDSNNYRVQKFTSSGVFVAQWGREGEANGEFIYPRSIAVSPSGNVYILDFYAHNIQKFSSDGTFLLKWGF